MTDDRIAAPSSLSVRFWGTRGSLPRPGPDFLRYGGNTTCVEVRLGNRLFLIDAGSGIEAAGRALLASRPLDFDILLSHLHHDHIVGLPFFPAALDKDCTIRTHCGNLAGASAQAAFDTMFAPPLFPVTLDVLPARFEHKGFRAGETLVFPGGITIRTCPLLHPGGCTAYRFDHGGHSLCYVADLEHQPGVIDPALIELCRGVDLVIYDSMFTDGEYQACRGWGHSTWGAGVSLCQAAGAKALAATHHHIRHTDTILDEVDRELRAIFPGSFLAREGQVITFDSKAAAVKRPSRLRETVV